MMNNFSDENFEVVTGHDGRKVRIVKDGGKVVVGMRFMDSMDAIQRQVASDYVADRPRVRAFDGTNAGLHRPGARFADERHVDPLVLQGNARDRALLYRMYDVEKASEFRGHPGGAYYQGGADEWRGSQPGDDCTVNGYPGTLVEEGGRLVCKIKRTDAAAYDDATCSRCGGSGIEPGHRQSGTHHEACNATTCQIMRASIDFAVTMPRGCHKSTPSGTRSLAEPGAKADDDPGRHLAADGADLLSQYRRMSFNYLETTNE